MRIPKVPLFIVCFLVLNALAFTLWLKNEDIPQIQERIIFKPIFNEIFNRYQQKEGLFSLEHRNDFEVRENEGIYYLRHLKYEQTAFQIFQNREDLSFEKEDYICAYEVCYSKNTPPDIVQNIRIQPEEKRRGDRYEFLTRAEALRWILELHSPNRSFASYGDDCFIDIKGHSLAPQICYAKEKEIISGIGNEFFPESSVNLYGLIKMLFLIFEVQELAVDEQKIPEKYFSLMTTSSLYYNFLASAFQEGLYLNERGEDIWPNRNIYKYEARQIVDRFFAWQDGKVLKNYNKEEDFELSSTVWIKDPHRQLHFEHESSEDPFKVKSSRRVLWKEQGGVVEVYYEEPGGIWEYLVSFKTESLIESITLEFNEALFKAQLEIEFEGKRKQELELQLNPNEFFYLKNKKKGTLKNSYLLPHRGVQKPGQAITQVKLYLSEEDFKSLNENRTVNTRYPAYMELIYPDGEVERQSVLIKTRGNASRGYVKSSYSIESFNEFQGHPDYDWDDFLEGRKEFKIRSFISDEEYFTEKILYQTFESLGYPEPHFFQMTVTLNGVDMGFYQGSEGIDDAFFEARGLQVEDYYFARNLATPYGGNLRYYENDEVTLQHYEVQGNETKLLNFIKALDANDPRLMQQIDVQNIFDYAMLVWSHNIHDSLFANFYLYIGEDDRWRIFFWDLDNALDDIPPLSKENFKEFVAEDTGRTNNLIYYVFKNLSEEDFDALWDAFTQNYSNQADPATWLQEYYNSYAPFVLWDNALWNGIHFERKITVFHSAEAIAKMKKKLEDLKKFFESV